MPSTDTPIRVVIADDSLVAREMLSQILSSDAGIEVVGQATDGIEAVELVARLRPDLGTMDKPSSTVNLFSATGKKVAAYHQYHAVKNAITSTIRASRPNGDRRGGVVWHTQGSGKSLTMVFFTGEIVLEPAMENPTVVVITDRNDLDDQLFGTFSRCRDLLRQTPVHDR